LHAQSFKSEIRRQGLCLEGNSGDERERHIAEHSIERKEISKKMERYEWGRTITMRMGMKDFTYSRNYRANDRKFQHGPILRGKCLVFFDKSSWANMKVVKSCEWSTI
jgi:hypothetical protein